MYRNSYFSFLPDPCNNCLFCQQEQDKGFTVFQRTHCHLFAPQVVQLEKFRQPIKIHPLTRRIQIFISTFLDWWNKEFLLGCRGRNGCYNQMGYLSTSLPTAHPTSNPCRGTYSNPNCHAPKYIKGVFPVVNKAFFTFYHLSIPLFL